MEAKSQDTGKKEDVIVSGTTMAALWHMSWPLLLDLSAISVATFADAFVAGRLGADQQAALGIGEQIWFFMVLLTIALSAGTSALVSRFWGQKDLKSALCAARQSLMLAFAFGLISSTAGIVLCRLMYRAFGAEEAVVDLGWQWMRIDLWAQIPFTLVWIVKTIFRAKGDARLPMLVSISMTLLIVVLDPLLCLWPAHLGLAGIGFAWLIAGILGALASFYLLKISEMGEALDWGVFCFKGISLKWFLRLFKIGLPASIQDLSWLLANFGLFLIFAKTADPTFCQAAFAVGSRIEQVASAMPMYALGMAVSTICGQNLGAARPKRAELAAWQAAGIGALLNFFVGLIMFFGCQLIAEMMSTDPRVIAKSSEYLRFNAVSEPFLAFQIVLFYAMQGAGYTRWPMILEVASLFCIRLPLAYILTITFALGAKGCWIGMAASVVVVGLLAIWRFGSGVWKQQSV